MGERFRERTAEEVAKKFMELAKEKSEEEIVRDVARELFGGDYQVVQCSVFPWNAWLIDRKTGAVRLCLNGFEAFLRALKSRLEREGLEGTDLYNWCVKKLEEIEKFRERIGWKK